MKIFKFEECSVGIFIAVAKLVAAILYIFADNSWKFYACKLLSTTTQERIQSTIDFLFLCKKYLTMFISQDRNNAPKLDRKIPEASYTRARRMVREQNARMCGWDCEPALCHPRTVRIPFAANWNLSVFCANTKRIGCTECPLLASGLWKIN